MLRILTTTLMVLTAATAGAQYPVDNRAANRNGYGGFASDPIVYSARYGPVGPVNSLDLARYGRGGVATSTDMSVPTNQNGSGGITFIPGGASGSAGLFNTAPIAPSMMFQQPRPVVYFSFSNSTQATTGGGFYLLPSR